MQLFTSWWFGKPPPDYIKIGISRGTPRGMPAGYRLYRKLAPGEWFDSVTAEVYRERYFAQLAQLDPQKVVDEVTELAKGKVPVLVCYESPMKPQDWCHRGMVSAWLHDQLGIEVFELGHEKDGCGWMHPKLPASMRRRPPPPVEAIDVTPYIGAEAEDGQGYRWKVIGPDPTNPDHALIADGSAQRSISGDVLRNRFQPVQ